MFDFRAQNVIASSGAAAPGGLQTQKSLPAVLDLDLEPPCEASRPKLDYRSTGSSHRATPLSSGGGIYIPPNLV